MQGGEFRMLVITFVLSDLEWRCLHSPFAACIAGHTHHWLSLVIIDCHWSSLVRPSHNARLTSSIRRHPHHWLSTHLWIEVFVSLLKTSFENVREKQLKQNSWSKTVLNDKDTSNCLQKVMKIIYFLIVGLVMRLSDFSLVGNIIDHEVLPWSIILPTNEKSDSLIRKLTIMK